MIYHLYRDAFSEVYTYRYRLTDVDEALLLKATWPATHAGPHPDKIMLQNAQEAHVADLHWQDRSWWRGDRFELRGADNRPVALIEEQWNIVDRMLLHLPRYQIHLPDGNRLETRGSRYGERFYELFVLPANMPDEKDDEAGVWLGEILHPPAGPTYTIKTNSPLLAESPTLTAAIMIVVDLWGLEKVEKA